MSSIVAQHLEDCGYKTEAVRKFGGETRLFHDMGVFGDNAADDLELLRRKFDIDFSRFPFDKYFPGHVGIEALVLTILCRSRWAERIRNRYAPITLNMLDEAIRQKRWPFD